MVVVVVIMVGVGGGGVARETGLPASQTICVGPVY